jgi:hypothetical protein
MHVFYYYYHAFFLRACAQRKIIELKNNNGNKNILVPFMMHSTIDTPLNPLQRSAHKL